MLSLKHTLFGWLCWQFCFSLVTTGFPFFFPLHYFYLFKLFKCFFFLLSHKSQGKFIHLSIVSKSNIFIFFFRVTFLFYRVENCIMFFFPQSFANTIEYLCVKDFVFRQQFRKNSLRYFYLIFHEWKMTFDIRIIIS